MSLQKLSVGGGGGRRAAPPPSYFLQKCAIICIFNADILNSSLKFKKQMKRFLRFKKLSGALRGYKIK